MRRGCAGVVGLVLLLGGCASPAVRVTPADPPLAYEGPLVLNPDQARNALERRAGAAGRAVQCETAGRGGLNIAAGYAGEVGKTPAKGLQIAIDEGSIVGPDQGWQQLRSEGDRAMFVVQFGEQAKAAVVMHRSSVLGNQFGWYAESYAYCNIAEFDPSVAAESGTQVWTDTSGRPVDTWTIASSAGPEHCDWTAVTFLNLKEGDLAERGGSTYLRHPPKSWVGDYVAESSQDSVALPAGAVDTGYRRAGKALWLSPNRQRAYVGVPGADAVELWPRTIQPLGCA